MATPGSYHNPAVESANLKDPEEKFAYEEGHDADALHHVSPKSETDIEKAAETQSTEATEPRDPNEVWWEEPENQDPQNPMNWPGWKKWGHIAILSYMTLITPLGSSVFAPGVPALLKEFGTTSQALATFVVSVYLLGFAFGPLIVAPLSELYGRYWVYTISNFLFVIFAVACAVSKNMTQLIVFRFFHGISGVSPLTIGSGTVADIIPIEKRGGAMAIWAMGPLLGPVIGPLGGAYLVEAKSWRWSFWLLAILSSLASILGLLLLRETYPPVLLERKAARLRKETGNQNLRSRLASNETNKEVFLRAIVRPTKMLLLSPVVAIICFYSAVAYGILYLLFTTFTFVFAEVYHFSTGSIGLTFIPLGLGMILSLVICGTVSDRIIKGKQARGETVVPEDRIPLSIALLAALFLPIGLFIYGWTTDKAVHWIAPMIGTCILGAGLLLIFMAMQTYLVDAFVRYAASATAANTVLRSLLGGLLPLCGLKMYDALGLGWGNSLLGFIAVALIPIPVMFSLYGAKIRNHPRFQLSL